MTAPRGPRPLPRWRQLALRAAAAVWALPRRRSGPLVDGLGYPTARHPDDAMRELPEADEEWLAAVAAGLWPDDEYAEILRGYPPDEGRGGE